MIGLNKKLDVEGAKRELAGDRITVGLATCGISAGGMPVFEALKKADLGIPVDSVGCIGMCYNEPLVTVQRIGKKSIFAKVLQENIDGLIKSIREKKDFTELLVAHDINELDFYKKQKRFVMENCG